MSKKTTATLCALIVGGISLGFYLATLAPGLTWAHNSGDGGDLAAAARTLGIPHPPGYPTYTLMAHPFTWLPIGEIATRTNLFSALCAAGASALLAWRLARTNAKWPAAVGAGLALALSPLLWSQATVTEVHALNGFFAALLLALTSPHPRRQIPLWALAIGGAWGLSLGNHPTALFLGPLALLALIGFDSRSNTVQLKPRVEALAGLFPPRGSETAKSVLLGLVGVLLGLSIYLYLPIRAAADPPINWGDPQTPERFWWMLSGGPYRQFVFSLPREHLPARLLAWSGLLTRQYTWIGLLISYLGAGALWKTDRALLGATGLIIALCSLFAIGYNTSDSYQYMVPALVCLGLWLGMGLDWLLAELETRTPVGWVGAALAIALPLAAALGRFSTMDLSDDRTVYEFESAVLGQAPSKALILSQRDSHTFALWYLQHAMGQRPDVLTVDLDLLRYEWYTARLPRQIAAPPTSATTQEAKDLQQRWATLLNRPVCRIDAHGTGLDCVDPKSDRSGN